MKLRDLEPKQLGLAVAFAGTLLAPGCGAVDSVNNLGADQSPTPAASATPDLKATVQAQGTQISSLERRVFATATPLPILPPEMRSSDRRALTSELIQVNQLINGSFAPEIVEQFSTLSDQFALKRIGLVRAIAEGRLFPTLNDNTAYDRNLKDAIGDRMVGPDYSRIIYHTTILDMSRLPLLESIYGPNAAGYLELIIPKDAQSSVNPSVTYHPYNLPGRITPEDELQGQINAMGGYQLTVFDRQQFEHAVALGDGTRTIRARGTTLYGIQPGISGVAVVSRDVLGNYKFEISQDFSLLGQTSQIGMIEEGIPADPQN